MIGMEETSPGGSVAVVHDWLPVLAGGEKVVGEICALLPRATLFTLFDFLSEEDRRAVSHGHPVKASPLNRLPKVDRYYRHLLLPCTRAIEGFDLRGHDLVISSSAALAKGVITGVDQPHIAYIHSPPRYAWDMTHEYLETLGGRGAAVKRYLAHRMLHKFRLWDLRTVNMIDHMVTNSQFVARRIAKIYRRDAEVIYPPVDTEAFVPAAGGQGDYFVTASRLVSYKRIDLIVEAFSRRPDLALKVVGDGPEMATIRQSAGPNITFCGRLPHNEMLAAFQGARAFVFAALEDFGIVPLEAQACGTPVIAYGAGGALETVRGLDSPAPTGVFFDRQTPESLLTALAAFEAVESQIDRAEVRRHAEGFSRAVFAERFGAVIADWRGNGTARRAPDAVSRKGSI